MCYRRTHIGRTYNLYFLHISLVWCIKKKYTWALIYEGYKTQIIFPHIFPQSSRNLDSTSHSLSRSKCRLKPSPKDQPSSEQKITMTWRRWGNDRITMWEVTFPPRCHFLLCLANHPRLYFRNLIHSRCRLRHNNNNASLNVRLVDTSSADEQRKIKQRLRPSREAWRQLARLSLPRPLAWQLVMIENVTHDVSYWFLHRVCFTHEHQR